MRKARSSKEKQSESEVESEVESTAEGERGGRVGRGRAVTKRVKVDKEEDGHWIGAF